MSRFIYLALAISFVVLCCPRGGVGQDRDELGRKLGQINSLITGTQTPLPLVQEKCDSLLKEYAAPEEQGRIFYLLTEAYGQARMSVNGNAAKVIEYAQKSLMCPLDPSRRLRLYIYWGDAIVLTDIKRPLRDTRAAAATVYLQGLKESKQYNIPDVVPKRPPAFVPTPGMDQETFRRQRAAHALEVERVLKLQELCAHRDGLEHQVLSAYSRRPRAPEELRKFATDVLGPGSDVEKLLGALAAKCEKVDKGFEN